MVVSGEEPPEPRFSVVIASYRWPDALRIAIESALAQTVREIEVIVVEDGRDTASREVVREIGDRRVRWVRKWFRSGSQAGPNEKGRRLARAPVVAYLGHDDIWAPNHLEGLLEALDSGADLVHSTTLMLGAPEGDLLAGSEPFTPDHFVPPSSMAHLKDSPRIARWPVSPTLTPQVDWHFFNSCFRRGGAITASGRPSTFKYAAIRDPTAFRRRDASRQQALATRLADNPDLGREVEADLLATGVNPILSGDPEAEFRPSETGGWGRRQKGFHGRFGLRSYRWQADAPEHFPGWGEPEADNRGRTFRQAIPDGSAWVRFDTPRRPWVAIRAELEMEADPDGYRLTIDGQPVVTRISKTEKETVLLSAGGWFWRRGRTSVVDVGVSRGGEDPANEGIPVYRIWLGRWPAGSDRHSRVWRVRLAAIRVARSRLIGR